LFGAFASRTQKGDNVGKHHAPRPRGYCPGGFRFPSIALWEERPRGFVGANDLARPVVTPFDAPRVNARDLAPVVVPRRHGAFRKSYDWRAARAERRAA
jgi:hypothetical protein